MDKKASNQRNAAHIFSLSLNCYLYIWNITSCSVVLHTRACLKGALLSDTLPADWRGHYHNDAALEEAVKDKSAAAALTLNFEHQHIISPGNHDSQSAPLMVSICFRLCTPLPPPRDSEQSRDCSINNGNKVTRIPRQPFWCANWLERASVC